MPSTIEIIKGFYGKNLSFSKEDILRIIGEEIGSKFTPDASRYAAVSQTFKDYYAKGILRSQKTVKETVVTIKTQTAFTVRQDYGNKPKEL